MRLNALPRLLIPIGTMAYAVDYPFTVTGSLGIFTRFPFNPMQSKGHSNNNLD